jgi:catechol 2,3-dioxygenase-like lactoylglutathione lyase family enzyme
MITGALTQVAQRTENLDRAVAFYGSVLGLPLLARFDPPGLAFFDLDGTRLLLGDGNLASMLYLAVDDIDATVERLTAAGVTFEQGAHRIHTDETGQLGAPGTEDWMAFFRDSEGNLLGLVERRPPA